MLFVQPVPGSRFPHFLPTTNTPAGTIQHPPTKALCYYLNTNLSKTDQTPPTAVLAISKPAAPSFLNTHGSSSPHNATMCCFMYSQHNCGHLHQWFARCHQAKHDQTGACVLQTIPTWHYHEAFPCPPCREQRKTDTAELVASKGRQTDSEIKAGKLKKESSQAPLPRQHSEQNAHPRTAQRHIAQPNSPEPGSRETQLQTMAEGALNLPPIALSAHTPWVPPSRRQASMVGQLGSSPPPQAHTRDSASTHSPEMLSLEPSLRPSSAISPPSPSPFQEGQPANGKMSVADMQLAHMLRQAET
jgi:hypothetical protein